MELADRFAVASGYVVSTAERETAEIAARSALESAIRQALKDKP